MAYRHLIDTCFSDRIGEHGLDRGAFEETLAATRPALESLRQSHEDGSLPLLRLPAARDDLSALELVAQAYREAYDDVVVLGTGGSSLGGQTLYALADAGFGPPRGVPRLHFMDNIDPDTFAELFRALAPGRTGFLVISKSGGTAETLTQFLIAAARWRRAVGEAQLNAHFILITEPKDNPLRSLARRWHLRCLDHDPGIGGRYSALSLVGLLPAMIAGLDAAAVRAGAAAVLESTLAAADPADSEPAVGAALNVALLRHRNITTAVLMPYVDRLARFGLWFRQLWAESLGKDGTGTTPIRALGTVDQHSQLQLYLAGPRDKMFTLILRERAGSGEAVEPQLAQAADLGDLAGRRMGDLLEAEQRATAETLARQGRPVRLFRLAALDERVMGALMMHFMLETIVAAHLIGVNPFDQPAVEEGKRLARRYLADMAEAAS